MRHLRNALVAVAALSTACVATSKQEERPPAPDLSTPAPAGTLTVGMTSGVAGASAQADAFAAWVKQATGKEVRKAVFPEYDQLAAELAKGTVDVALMPPLAYVRANTQNQKVEPLLRVVRNGQPTYRAVLFTKQGSPVKSLDDLKKARNLKAAWVDSSSSTGYIFPKALLITKKIDPAGIFVSQDFLGKHDAVCKAVVEGKADVGATFSDDPGSGPATHVSGCEQALGANAPVQIVAATENIPNDVLAVRSGFPDDEKAKLNAAADQLAKGGDKATLKSAFNAEGFAPVADADFEPVRAALDAFRQ